MKIRLVSGLITSTAHLWSLGQSNLHIGWDTQKESQALFPDWKLCLPACESALRFLGPDGEPSHSSWLWPDVQPTTVCSMVHWRMWNCWLLKCFSSHWALKVKGLLEGWEQTKFTQLYTASDSPEPHSIMAHRRAEAYPRSDSSASLPSKGRSL